MHAMTVCNLGHLLNFALCANIVHYSVSKKAVRNVNYVGMWINEKAGLRAAGRERCGSSFLNFGVVVCLVYESRVVD